MVKELPHLYQKGDNVNKIWGVYTDFFNEIIDVLNKCHASHLNPYDYDNVDYLLDQVGENWGCVRPTGMSDLMYRDRIAVFISSYLMSGNLKELHDFMRDVVFKGDENLFTLKEIHHMLETYGIDDFSAYLEVGLFASASAYSDFVEGFIQNSKVAGVGLLMKIFNFPILGDDGNAYEIFNRQTIWRQAGIRSIKDSHIINPSTLDPIDIVIEDVDGLTGNYRIRINTDLRLYLEPTTDPVSNNIFLVNSNTYYTLYAKGGYRIVWEKDETYNWTILGDDGLQYRIFSRSEVAYTVEDSHICVQQEGRKNTVIIIPDVNDFQIKYKIKVDVAQKLYLELTDEPVKNNIVISKTGAYRIYAQGNNILWRKV